MNTCSPLHGSLNDATPKSDQPAAVDNAAQLEQQMAALGLSDQTRRFLRDLQRAEKVLNKAYDKTPHDGALDKRISQIYHDLYGRDETASADS